MTINKKSLVLLLLGAISVSILAHLLIDQSSRDETADLSQEPSRPTVQNVIVDRRTSEFVDEAKSIISFDLTGVKKGQKVFGYVSPFGNESGGISMYRHATSSFVSFSAIVHETGNFILYGEIEGEGGSDTPYAYVCMVPDEDSCTEEQNNAIYLDNGKRR